ncbi:gfo/Idh/MocA family oxidoreductase [Aquicoccus sp. SCR17]|nr:gfo/Idh/MocA family oxidoreductase [Carideicomes alvinocaridis]
MTDHIRWGILGASNFARGHMAPAIHLGRRGRLAALATASARKAAAFTEMVPDLRVHEDYDALLADPEIDAVYIPLPNHLHVEWTTRAMAAGKHVLCEKPLALRAEEFAPIVAERDRTGLLVAEAYMIVHHPQWQRARQLVRDGAIGELVQVDGVFSYMNTDLDNIRNRAEAGGGAIRDIGVYPYGGARYVTGEEPEEITHVDIRMENGVDVWVQVAARFPSFRFSAINSMRMAPRQEMSFHGTEGMVRLPVPFNARVFGEARVEWHRPGMEVVTERFPAVDHYVAQVEAFNASLLDGADFSCPLEFSRGTQAMLDAVFAKAS